MNMKKFSLLLILAVLFILLSAERGFATSEGSLVLDTNVLNNQETSVGRTNDFPIRAQLFSTQMDEQIKLQLEKKEAVAKQIAQVDFEQESTNQLFVENYEVAKSRLFENYKSTSFGDEEQGSQSVNNQLWFLLVIALPLLLLTNIFAKYLARKRRSST
jgi:hypothetical protein